VSTVNWKAMTTRQVWDALTAAPKIAGPWVKNEDDRDERQYVGGAHVLGEPVAFDTGRGYKVQGMPWSAPFYDDRAEADAALRAAGWLLVE
jgi:hypothetical protein